MTSLLSCKVDYISFSIKKINVIEWKNRRLNYVRKNYKSIGRCYSS